MDPNACLKRIFTHIAEGARVEAAEAIRDLDEWLNDGWDPDWRKHTLAFFAEIEELAEGDDR